MEQHSAQHCESLYRDFCKPRFDRIEKSLDDIRVALTGNGKDGLVHRIVALETKCASSQNAASRLWSVLAPTISALIIAVLGWLAAEIMRQRSQLNEIYHLKSEIKQYWPEGLLHGKDR